MFNVRRSFSRIIFDSSSTINSLKTITTVMHTPLGLLIPIVCLLAAFLPKRGAFVTGLAARPITSTRTKTIHHPNVANNSWGANFPTYRTATCQSSPCESSLNVDKSHDETVHLGPSCEGPSTDDFIPTSTTTAATLTGLAVLTAWPEASASASAAESTSTTLAAIIPTTGLSALWAYAHFFSISAITGCLVAERLIVKANMSLEEENIIVKLDLLYGLLAVLLIGSGFIRATDGNFGKGGDFYIHDVMFWIKMTVSGVWGGLSLFPSLTFYQRKYAREKQDESSSSLSPPPPPPPPVSDALAARLHSILNAELSAILTIPLLATLMARGVWYWPDCPWQIGMVTAIAATGGSFFYYGRQALTWTEED